MNGADRSSSKKGSRGESSSSSSSNSETKSCVMLEADYDANAAMRAEAPAPATAEPQPTARATEGKAAKPQTALSSSSIGGAEPSRCETRMDGDLSEERGKVTSEAGGQAPDEQRDALDPP